MCYPHFDLFKQMAKTGNIIPVYSEILADTVTPVSAYYLITEGLKQKFSFLLESVEQGGRLGRYSFLSAGAPHLVFSSKNKQVFITNPTDGNSTNPHTTDADKPLTELRKILAEFQPVESKELPRFWGGAVGYVAYDYIRHLEKIPILTKPDLDIPETNFMLTRGMLIFDHLLHKIKVLVNVYLTPQSSLEKEYSVACDEVNHLIELLRQDRVTTPITLDNLTAKYGTVPLSSNFTQPEYMQAVKKAIKYIRQGDIVQVVPSQRFSKEIHPDLSTVDYAFRIYRSLRTINPSPYMFFFQFNDLYLVGSSPEILVRKDNRIAEVRPIAGTRPRGVDSITDMELEKNLLHDEKERAEHVMLVDLGRNDLGRVCVPGTVKVAEFMSIERYSHVMHIVSSVTGKLKPKEDAFSLFHACFPAGTVTGAPKIRAMQIIEELEPVRRGIYAGAVGYFSFAGNMDVAIAIRTIVINKKQLYLQAGGGVVADSVPQREFMETINKAKALKSAIELAERGIV